MDIYRLWLIISIQAIAAFNYGETKEKSFTPSRRVVQGWSDTTNRYPYVVSLELVNESAGKKYIFRHCTGTLIHRQWVITTAHCTSPDLRRVRYGNMTARDSKCHSKILVQLPHPTFKIWDSIMENDIALIYIEGIDMQRYSKLHGGDYKTFTGRSVRYAGFGLTYRYYDRIPSDILMKEQMKPLQIGEGFIFTNEKKLKEYQPRLLIAPKCGNKEQFPHKGDSGGPVFVGDRLVGVCSGGNDPLKETIGDPDVISAYTPISPYLNWIRETMQITFK